MVNNSRLVVLPACHYPNLVSRFMKLMLARLSEDWQVVWKHPVVLAETFVDPALYRGTAYQVSGWSRLGATRGWKRSTEDFYQKHDQPKEVWVRELVKRACPRLRAVELPAAWAAVASQVAPRCTAKADQIGSLMEGLRREVPEFRRRQALAYPVAGMVALIAMALFSGVAKGYEDLAEYAATLSQGQLRALGFRIDPHTRRVRCPKKRCFERVLAEVDTGVIERVLLRWQDQVLGPTQDRLVILNSPGRHRLSPRSGGPQGVRGDSRLLLATCPSPGAGSRGGAGYLRWLGLGDVLQMHLHLCGAAQRVGATLRNRGIGAPAADCPHDDRGARMERALNSAVRPVAAGSGSGANRNRAPDPRHGCPPLAGRGKAPPVCQAQCGRSGR